mmetsp:Transcript_7387/g.11236  ORF Transcript_7387/g.11236 Transcript_7387/m.11236 type:complete len:306 (-) Transcript_7387:394-1311(-)
MVMMTKTATEPPLHLQREILSDQRCSELLSMLAKRGDGRETIKVLLTMMLGENQDPCFQTEEGSITTSPTITTDDEGNEIPDLSLNKKDVLQVISMMEKNNGKETVEGLLQRINKSKLPHDNNNNNNNNESDNSTTKDNNSGENGGKESSSFKEDTMRAIMSTASKNLPSSSKKKISPDAVYKLAFQITNSVVDSVKLGKYEEEESPDIGSSSSGKDANSKSSTAADDPFSAMTKSNNKRFGSAKRSRSMTGAYGNNFSSRHYKEGFELSDPMIGHVNIHGMEQGGGGGGGEPASRGYHQIKQQH